MKKILILVLFLLIPFAYVNAAGSIKTNTSSLTIEPGKAKTFKITASNSAGRVDISSSNPNVATVSVKNQFLDNSSVSIKVTGKAEGTATINIKLTDVATYDGQVLTGTKTVKITVKKAEPKKETPVVPVVKEMNITRLEVIGYDIGFNKDNKEYTIDIDEKVSKVYVAAGGENAKITGAGEVNINNTDSIVVRFQNITKQEDYKEYTIKFNKVGKAEPETITKEVIKEVEKDTNKVSRGFLYSTIVLGILCLLLLFTKLRKPEKRIEVIEPVESMESTIVPETTESTIASGTTVNEVQTTQISTPPSDSQNNV